MKTTSRKKIADTVFDRISEKILSREWAPGDKLPSENEIAQQMSVSRISVRAALQRLSALGIVESRQGEGTFVCEYTGKRQLMHLSPFLSLTQTDYVALREFRMILETNSARLAVRNCTPEILAELEQNYEIYKLVTSSGNDNIELDIDFHQLIAKATGNPFLQETMSILRDYLIMSIQRHQAAAGVESGVYYHRKILDAIRNHDEQAAYDTMAEHLMVHF